MEEKLQHVERILDDMGGVQFMKDLVECFGFQHAARLAGWAVLWGITGVENTPEYRQRLIDRGLAHATVYRAAADWRKFGEWLEAKYHRPFSSAEMELKLRQEVAAGPVQK
jgi:hypothetical protein